MQHPLHLRPVRDSEALTSGASWAELLAWAQNVVNHKFPASSYATLLLHAAEYNAL